MRSVAKLTIAAVVGSAGRYRDARLMKTLVEAGGDRMLGFT